MKKIFAFTLVLLLVFSVCIACTRKDEEPLDTTTSDGTVTQLGSDSESQSDGETESQKKEEKPKASSEKTTESESENDPAEVTDTPYDGGVDLPWLDY